MIKFKVLTATPHINVDRWIESLTAHVNQVLSTEGIEGFSNTTDLVTPLTHTRYIINTSIEDHLKSQESLIKQLKGFSSGHLAKIVETLGKLAIINASIQQASQHLSPADTPPIQFELPVRPGIVFTAHPTIWLREFALRVIGQIRKTAKYINATQATHRPETDKGVSIAQMIQTTEEMIHDFARLSPKSESKPSFAKIVMVIANTPFKNVMTVTAEACINSAKATLPPDYSPQDLASKIKVFSAHAAPGSWAGYDCDGAPNVNTNTFRQSASLWSMRNLGHQRDNLQKVLTHLQKVPASIKGVEEATLRIQKIIYALGLKIERLSNEITDALDNDIQPKGSLEVSQHQKAIEELNRTVSDIFTKTPQPQLRDADLPTPYNTVTEFREAVEAVFVHIHHFAKPESKLALAMQKALAMATANGFFGAHIQRREEVNLLEDAVLDIAAKLGGTDPLALTHLDESKREVFFTALYQELSEISPEKMSQLDLSENTLRQVDHLRFLKAQYELDPNSVRYHVLSMCRTPSNFLSAMCLFKIAGLENTAITPVPLFEMPEDLKNASHTIKTLTHNPVVKAFLERPERQPKLGLSQNAPDVRFIGKSGLPRSGGVSRSDVVELPENRADEVFCDSPKLKIMLAHSDSTRTSGMAAKMRHFLIRHELKHAQENNELNGVHIEFYDGGGSTQPRGGTKAMYLHAMASLSTEQNENRDATYQGEDLTSGFASKHTTETTLELVSRGVSNTPKPSFIFSEESLQLFREVTDRSIDQYRTLFFLNPNLVEAKINALGIGHTKLANLSPRPSLRPSGETSKDHSRAQTPDEPISKKIQALLIEMQATLSKLSTPQTEDLTGDPIQDSRTISVVAATQLTSSLLAFNIGMGSALKETLTQIQASMSQDPQSIFNHPYVIQYIFTPILLLFANTSWPVLAQNCHQAGESGIKLFTLIQREAQDTYDALKTLLQDRPEFKAFFDAYETFGSPTSTDVLKEKLTHTDLTLMIYAALKQALLDKLSDKAVTSALTTVMLSAPALNSPSQDLGGLYSALFTHPHPSIGTWG